MFKKTAVAVPLLLISNIACSDGFYLSGNLGAAIPTNTDVNVGDLSVNYNYNLKSSTGLAAGLAVGLAMGNFRVETEMTYQENNILSVYTPTSLLPPAGFERQNVAGLLNGYYDFKNKSNFTPYLSIGIGGANTINKDRTTNIEENKADLASQIGGGIDYTINEKVSVGLKYRYFQTSSLVNIFETIPDYSSHNVYAGFRFSFGN